MPLFVLLVMLQSLLSLVFQANCPLCDRPANQEACEFCLRQLLECRLAEPLGVGPGGRPLLSWGGYGGTVRRAIAVLKYERQPQLAFVLGKELGEAWAQAGGQGLRQRIARAVGQRQLRVVPIPLHTDKLKQRGFNQAERIAEAFCRRTGLGLCRQGLIRVRQTEAQFSLSGAERERNLQSAFVVGPGLGSRGREAVVLVDDIYTSGATVRAAIAALQAQQIPVVAVAVVARAGLAGQ